MSTSPKRRKARQDKRDRTHSWVGASNYEHAMFTLASDMLDEMAPRPSQHVATDIGSRFNVAGDHCINAQLKENDNDR